ncbi:MAG TPA: class I SAM-dependent methyltransferase [Gemmatimonadaceae bacterium]
MPELQRSAEWLDPLLMSASSPYDRAMLALHLERYRLAAEYVGNADVVDCACGTGFGSEMLAKAGAASVQGVDLDRNALVFARAQHAHPAIVYYEADVLRYVPAAKPTVWVSIETIEHLPNPRACIARVVEVLPQGGRFIASVPVTVSTDRNPHHLWNFSRESFRNLLKSHGLVEERALEQTHRFTLGDVFAGARKRDRRHNLAAWYARHPSVLAQRVRLTITKGFVDEYLTVVVVKK